MTTTPKKVNATHRPSAALLLSDRLSGSARGPVSECGQHQVKGSVYRALCERVKNREEVRGLAKDLAALNWMRTYASEANWLKGSEPGEPDQSSALVWKAKPQTSTPGTTFFAIRQHKMVVFFTSNVVEPAASIYMGKDKVESQSRRERPVVACSLADLLLLVR